MRSLSPVLAGLSLLALAACASPPPPPTPTVVELGITGAADMNDGAPARVKVYYLKAPAAFAAADFFALFEAPEATLGADLLDIDELQLAPGRMVTASKSFDTPPAALGVVAAFRDVGGPGFRAIQPLAPNTANTVPVTLTGNTVVIGQ